MIEYVTVKMLYRATGKWLKQDRVGASPDSLGEEISVWVDEIEEATEFDLYGIWEPKCPDGVKADMVLVSRKLVETATGKVVKAEAAGDDVDVTVRLSGNATYPAVMRDAKVCASGWY